MISIISAFLLMIGSVFVLGGLVEDLPLCSKFGLFNLLVAFGLIAIQLF